MDQRVCLALWPLLAACAGSPAVSRAARVASPPPRAVALAGAAPVSVRAEEPARPTSEYDEQAANDRNYVENTKGAVALYREFIARAGSDPQYAAAVKRSREQIDDLTNAGTFVEEGMKQRTEE